MADRPKNLCFHSLIANFAPFEKLTQLPLYGQIYPSEKGL
jgi:hypothetical protein